MFMFTFLGKVLVGFSYHYIHILSSILHSIIMVISRRIQGRGPGDCAPLHYFCTKLRRKGPKKIFLRPAPPLIISESGWPPPFLSEGLDLPLVIAFNWSNNNYFYK